MTEHTHGPWIVFHADADGANDVLPAMRAGHIARDIEKVADARLIASAPDMLHALKLVQIYAKGNQHPEDEDSWAWFCHGLMDKVNAAVAKAEGKP